MDGFLARLKFEHPNTEFAIIKNMLCTVTDTERKRFEFVSWFVQCPIFKRFFYSTNEAKNHIFWGIFLIENKIECLWNLLCHHFIQSPNHSTWKHSISQCVRQCVRCLIKYDEELSLSNWKMDFFLPPSQCYQCFVAFQSANELAKSNHSYFQFDYRTWKPWGVQNCCGCGISIHQVLSDHRIISGMKVFDNLPFKPASKTLLSCDMAKNIRFSLCALCLLLTLQSVTFMCANESIIHIHIHSFLWIELLWKYLALNVHVFLVVFVQFISHPGTKSFELNINCCFCSAVSRYCFLE